MDKKLKDALWKIPFWIWITLIAIGLVNYIHELVIKISAWLRR